MPNFWRAVYIRLLKPNTHSIWLKHILLTYTYTWSRTRSGPWNRMVINKQKRSLRIRLHVKSAKSGYWFPSRQINPLIPSKRIDQNGEIFRVYSALLFLVIWLIMIKQIIWSTHWHLPGTVRHFESNESTPRVVLWFHQYRNPNEWTHRVWNRFLFCSNQPGF